MTRASHPTQHAQRVLLHNEVHARPPEALVAPLNRITSFNPPSIYADIPAATSAPDAPTITVEGRACR